jgi:epsilon-lactone hydrolase
MASEQVARMYLFWKDLRDAIRGLPPGPELRAECDARFLSISHPDQISSELIDAAGVSAEWVVPNGFKGDRVVFYVHGGGFMTGSPETHRDLVYRICQASGARALSVGYRLAPEHLFPAWLQDTVTCYRWLLAHGVDASQVAMVGDSVGGGLIISALLALRDQGVDLPAAGASISPWADFTASGESRNTNSELGGISSADAVNGPMSIILGEADPRDPLASPIFGDFTRLPPLLIMVGSREPLVSDAEMLADRAKQAAVDVTYEVWDEMDHIWPLFATFLPEGQQAVERIGEFIRRHLPS